MAGLPNRDLRRRMAMPTVDWYQGIPPTVDPSFKKRLKEFDPKLKVKFDRETHRFAIYRKQPFGDDFKILIVAGPLGEFRQPDQREIAVLYAGDLWRKGRLKDFVLSSEAKILENMAREDKKVRDELQEVSRDNKLQLRRMYRKHMLGEGKDSEYRRVDPNRRGLTMNEIQEARSKGKDPWNDSNKVS